MTPFDCPNCKGSGTRTFVHFDKPKPVDDICPSCGGSGIDPELRGRLSEIIDDVRAEDGRTRGREMPPTNGYWASIFEAAVVAYWKEKE